MRTIAIRDLKPGARLVNEDESIATVASCRRETVLEGDFYLVETDMGSFCLEGGDKVQLATTEKAA